MNVNLVIVAGNITRDIEIKSISTGTALATFSIAVNKRWNSKTGDKKDKTTFIECKAFGKTAELIGQYFRKGSRFYGQGEIDVESWTDKASGQKRSKTLVLINEVQFIDKAAAATPVASPDPVYDNSDEVPY